MVQGYPLVRVIHYMVRDPRNLGQLVYPIDIPDLFYHAYGSFFIDGQSSSDLDDTYNFYSMYNEVIISITLRRTGEVSFAANVDGLGQFLFRATKIGMPAQYGGQYSLPNENLLIRQLAPYDRRQLELASQEHDFYFIGYSPQIEGGMESKPVDPLLTSPSQGQSLS